VKVTLALVWDISAPVKKPMTTTADNDLPMVESFAC
jgi:hypothetical protein